MSYTVYTFSLFYATSFSKVGNDSFLSFTMPGRDLSFNKSSLNADIKINGAEAESISFLFQSNWTQH